MRWKFVNGKWIEAPSGSGEGIYIDGYFKKRLDNVRKIIKKGYDCVILIDGKERTGKSTLGMTAGHYLSDTKLGIDNFASGMEDASKKIGSLPDHSVLIVDEGSLVFSSKDTIMKEQKQLMKVMDVVGQKNMIFIIILPSFFDLNRAIALRRSKFLLHVYTDKQLNRGRFSFFGEKKKRKLYDIGRKNFGSYQRPKADFNGAFENFEPEFYKQYLELKKKSLIEALNPEQNKNDLGFKYARICRMRNIMFYYLNKQGVSQKKIMEILNQFGESIAQSTLTESIELVKKDLEAKGIPIELPKPMELIIE